MILGGNDRHFVAIIPEQNDLGVIFCKMNILFYYLQDYIYYEPQSDGSKLLNFKINSSFFKVDPRILNSIFFKEVETGKIDEDQLYVSAHFEIHKVTNLDYLGLPM